MNLSESRSDAVSRLRLTGVLGRRVNPNVNLDGADTP